MSRPIKLTENLKKQAIKEFEASLSNLKMSDGKINYSKNFLYKDEEKAEILFTPSAYAKMINLLMSFDSEVAWHGVGERIDGDTFKVLIRDILVYPQTVTGSNVDMNPETYAKWLMENYEDDRFNHIVMQGHSHVNFSTTPSAVDLKHQEDILAQLTDDMFYVFLIWNKKMEHTTKIYDLKTNTLFEDKDIIYNIIDENTNINAFISESKNMVKKHEVKQTPVTNDFSTYYNGGYGNWYSDYNSTTNNQNDSKKNKSKKKDEQFYGLGYCERGYNCTDN